MLQDKSLGEYSKIGCQHLILYPLFAMTAIRLSIKFELFFSKKLCQYFPITFQIGSDTRFVLRLHLLPVKRL